ncbi:glycoside hydrolase family 5 protein [Kitasatospora paracochleata]|uniref:Glycoside hydrolase family 5 domain-containing protein n=1 Tax=Kitasatospora paracochleata TaxID=58354 RepID=A0ABT1IWG2_9ACTN|nr:cellulase family glycosylhydrolase [Kitasatospora paracochleata]MCP2309482.1 hypothetical protein [Kitasatospora paracochleata]
MRSTTPNRFLRAAVTRALPATLVAGALLIGAVPGPVAVVSPAAAAGSAPVALTGKQLAASWTGPLSTQGRYVVDAKGNRFKLKAGNWDGAQSHYLGSGDENDPANNQAGEVSHNIPMGLDRVPIAKILADFHALGLNTIRLPYADAMIDDTDTVPDSAVAANPQLRDKTPLEVYDAVVKALTADGFAVVLNNHTTTYHWCCGLDGNERWNKGQSAQKWEDDWLFMVERYKDNKRVVGADLRNEIRRDGTDDPNWDWGDDHDAYAAYQETGNRILDKDPDMLIIMEGINWVGIPSGITSHWRPNLEPVRNMSNTLMYSNKLVYSVHFYGFTGPNHTGASGGWQNGETNDPRYRDLSPEDLEKAVNDEALFVTESGQHFTAPVWVSEFGTGGRGQTDAKEKDWFRRFTDILVKNDTDFAIWPLVGWANSSGKPNDNWAALSYAANGKRTGLEDGGDWRAADWNKLVTAGGKTGKVAKAERWNMINLDHGNQNASSYVRANFPIKTPGNLQGSCPDGERLIGLSRYKHRGLCTNVNEPAITNDDWEVVTDAKYMTDDWAPGWEKAQCPEGTMVAGYSMWDTAFTSVMCQPVAASLGTSNRVVWFDRGDNPAPTDKQARSDWAPWDSKGQCRTDEYLAGVAFNWSSSQKYHDTPDALLCRPLD